MKFIFKIFTTLLATGLLLSIYLGLTLFSHHNVTAIESPPAARILFTSEKRETLTMNRKLAESDTHALNDTHGYILMHKPKRQHPQKIAANKKHNLCLFIWSTTNTAQHAQELRDIMDIYRERDDVYFVMDHLRGVLQYEVCNIAKRCLFIDYDMNSAYKLSQKTISAFQYIYDRRFYDKCNWIMKSDTDSYVDIDRFNDFLSHNYNPNDEHYLGEAVSCEATKHDSNILMAQGGGYLISQAVLRNHEWDFSAMAPSKYDIMGMEDCMFASMLYKELQLKVNSFNNAGFYLMRNERSIEREWKQSKMKHAEWGLNGCTFVWHKVSQAFRLKLIAELKQEAFHTNHCKKIARKSMEYKNGTLFIEM